MKYISTVLAARQLVAVSRDADNYDRLRESIFASEVSDLFVESSPNHAASVRCIHHDFRGGDIYQYEFPRKKYISTVPKSDKHCTCYDMPTQLGSLVDNFTLDYC
jgi:hypothetical protein